MLLQSIIWWLQAFLAALPALLPRWIAAWLLCLILLIYAFRALKPHVRPHALRVDERLRAWAKGLRYHDIPEQAEAKVVQERTWLTWFFRFWTNFASAPSLSFFSVAVPVWFYHQDRLMPHNIVLEFFDAADEAIFHFHHTDWWLLPGLCFSGSMLLSFVVKRVFKRVRPPIERGAFGHKLMKDPSFPSGHSLTSFCFWSMMTVSVIHSGAPAWASALFAGVAVNVVALTGLSRIYLAVHFPSDVLGGYTIGLVWSVICYLALRGAL